MTYKMWLAMYKEAMDILDAINNDCPHIADDSAECYKCKLIEKCKFVRRTCSLQPNKFK